jgi:hypothetical protein
MVQVIVGTNVKRETKIVSENTTLRQTLEEAGVDYTRGGIHLDGVPLQAGDIDKTFADLNVKERAYLLSVVKADSAA